MWKGLFALIAGTALLCYVFVLGKREKKKHEKPFISEREKYYDNMTELGYTPWQIEELIKDFKTFEELKQVNRRMERSLYKAEKP